MQGEEVLVDLAPLDDGLGRRLGAFVVTAVQELTLGLGLSGEEGGGQRACLARGAGRLPCEALPCWRLAAGPKPAARQRLASRGVCEAWAELEPGLSPCDL